MSDALVHYDVEGGVAVFTLTQQQLFESEDAREGIAANLEKRKPAFKGR